MTLCVHNVLKVSESSFEAEQTANREVKGEGENQVTTGSNVVGTACSFKGPGW